MEKEFNDITKNLKKALDTVMILQSKVFNDMPEGCKDQIIPIQKDIAEAMGCIKSGDLTKINEISQKYAGITNK